MQGARGGADLSPGDISRVKAHLARYCEKMDEPTPWQDEE